MSFGWSIGDIIAGINTVWVAWQAISDGPLNSQYQAQQFFTRLGQIAKRLDHWEERGLADEQDTSSRQELKKECQEFVERHMDLIQEVVPKARTDRQIKCYDSVGGKYQTITRSWLRKAEVTRQQAELLYQKVKWPFEEKKILRLEDQLRIFLDLATYDFAAPTYKGVQEIREFLPFLALYRPSNEDLQIFKDSKELVSIVKTILMRVTNPLGPDEEIDYPMLHQLAQLLPPAQPLRQIEGASSEVNIPWQTRHGTDEAQYSTIPVSSAFSRKILGSAQQNEIRSTLMRLDNLSMRRVETIDTISASSLIAQESVQTSIERLQSMRGHIGHVVGIVAVGIDATQSNGMAAEKTEPENALQKEMTEWSHLYELIERGVLHPGPHLAHPAESIDVPRRSSPGSPDSVSPGSSPGLHAQVDTYNISRHPLSLPPNQHLDCVNNRNAVVNRPGSLESPPTLHRRSTTASTTAPHFIKLTRALKTTIMYKGITKMHTVNAIIHSIARFGNGDVQAILASKEDGLVHFHHSVDMKESPTSKLQ